MNSVHRCHDPETFKALTHYIFTFHDSTFECVAASFTFTVEDVGPGEEYGRTLEVFKAGRPKGIIG